MARIAGINIPPHQHAEIGLTAIFGIGRTRARKICELTGIPYSKKVKDLSDTDLEKIRDQIAQFTIEGDLRLLQDLLGCGVADPENIGQRHYHALVGQVHTGKSCHELLLKCCAKCGCLALALLVLGRHANHAQYPAAADDLALVANLLHGRSNLHDSTSVS